MMKLQRRAPIQDMAAEFFKLPLHLRPTVAPQTPEHGRLSARKGSPVLPSFTCGSLSGSLLCLIPGVMDPWGPQGPLGTPISRIWCQLASLILSSPMSLH